MSNISQISFDGMKYSIGPEISDLDFSKLIPENIRKGVVLFEGTEHEVIGSLTYLDLIPDTDIDLFDGETINPIIGKFMLFSGGTTENPYIRGGKIIFGEPTGPYGTIQSNIFATQKEIDTTKFNSLVIEYGGTIVSQRPINIGYINSNEEFINVKTWSSPDGPFTNTVTINLNEINDNIRPAIGISRFTSDTIGAYIISIVLKKYDI